MGIQRTYGAGAVAQAGQAAGQARIKETQAAQALQMQRFREELAHGDAVRQMNRHWDLEKESRARSWEIEKMETASRIDNELENKNYIKKMSQWQAGDEYIDSIADKHPPEQITMMRFTLDQQFAKDIPKAAARLGVGLYEKAMMDAKKKGGVLGLLGGEGGGIGPDNVLGLDIESPKTAARTEAYTIPPTEQERQLEAENKFRVISPNGDEEIIKGEDWSTLKEKGYILADIAELRRKRSTYTPPQGYYQGFGGRGI